MRWGQRPMRASSQGRALLINRGVLSVSHIFLSDYASSRLSLRPSLPHPLECALKPADEPRPGTGAADARTLSAFLPTTLAPHEPLYPRCVLYMSPPTPSPAEGCGASELHCARSNGVAVPPDAWSGMAGLTGAGDKRPCSADFADGGSQPCPSASFILSSHLPPIALRKPSLAARILFQLYL
ncbi:hypothetical protein OF83DRAFT_1117301 [Amylostereum chailletii]|nr:hypothetical protein OF83DRAFT_1117301 [Amylostereum chailletii]